MNIFTVIGGFLFWLSRYLNPLFFSLAILALLYVFYLNLDDIKRLLGEVKPLTWLLLTVMLLSSIFVSYNFSQPPTASGKLLSHAHISQVMRHSYSEYTSRTLHRVEFYPFVLFLAFSLFGASVETVTALGTILFALTSVIVFVSVYLITENDFYALISSLLFLVSPLPVICSQVGSAMPLYGLIAATAFFFLLLSLRTKTLKSTTLFLLAYLLALATRIEAIYLLGMFALAYLLFFKASDYKKLLKSCLIVLVFVLPILPFLFLSAGFFGHNFDSNKPQTQFFRQKYPHASASTFSLTHLPRNLSKITRVMSRRGFFHYLFLPFLFLGLYFAKKNPLMSLPLLWILSFFLFFGTWFSTAIVSMKLHLYQLYIPLAIVLGVGLGFAGKRLLSLLEANLEQVTISRRWEIILTLFLISLVLLPSVSTFYADKDTQGENIYAEVSKSLSKVPPASCVLVDKGRIGVRAYPYDLVRFSTDREVKKDLKQCQGQKIFYLKLGRNFGPKQLPPDFYQLYDSLKRRCQLKAKVNSTELTLFRVIC